MNGLPEMPAFSRRKAWVLCLAFCAGTWLALGAIVAAVLS